MARLTLRLMGGFEAEVDGSPVARFASDKERALLAYTLLHADRPLPRQRLAALLWPDQPQDKALHSCRQALSSLRKLLRDEKAAEPVLLVSRDTVQANRASGFALDVESFRGELDRATHGWNGREGGGRLDVRALRRAVALCDRALLDGLSIADAEPFEEWLLIERESLTREAVQAFSLLADYHERRGELAAAMGIAERVVRLVPSDEAAHYLVMRLAAADGQWAVALAQYRACTLALRSLADARPSASTEALIAEVRLATRTGQTTPRACPRILANLPPEPTPFVGREREMDDLARLLADPHCRLLTLVGPGGVGKTRLALAAARVQLGLWREGVFLAALADIAPTQPLAPAIAAAVGLSFSDRASPEQQLLDYLRSRQLLLVLDNLEHLPAAPSLLSDLLGQAAGVAVIATSRERLNLREEWVFPVSGLACPSEAERMTSYGASNLFLNATRRTDARFSPTDDDRVAIARICRALDGLPLGLELAAGMLRQATCTEIAADLEQDLRSLAGAAVNAPERQRSLRATFAHSWQLLAPEEREVFRRLSVFRGGVDREAAAAVTGATPELLAALVDKSLLWQDGPDRYQEHELLRQFGAEHLALDTVALDEVRARHAEHYVGLLASVGAPERERARAFDALSRELRNIRHAWSYVVDAARLDLIEKALPALFAYHEACGLFEEGADLLETAAAAVAERSRPALYVELASNAALLAVRAGLARRAAANLQRLEPAVELVSGSERALYHHAQAHLALHLGEHEQAADYARLGEAAAAAAGNNGTRAGCLYVQGVVSYRAARPEEAQALLEESLRLARLAGRDRQCVATLNMIGDVACHPGHYDAALAVFGEALALCHEVGDEAQAAVILNSIGTVHHVRGDLEAAAACYERSLVTVRGAGDRAGQAIALGNLGELARSSGDVAGAHERFREGLDLAQGAGATWPELACLDNLASLALAEGEVAESSALFRRAIGTARRTATLTAAPRLLVHVAPLLTQLGDDGLAAAALSQAACHPASEAYTRREAETLLSELSSAPAAPDLPLEPLLDLVLARLQ